MLDWMLAAVAVLAPQAQTRWQVIDINTDQSRVLTVDIASRPASPAPDAIIKARVFVTVDMPNITALVGYWTINCGKRMHQVSGTSTYDETGLRSAPDTETLDWQATQPGTLFESVADYVCRGTIKHPGKIVAGDAPIAAANAMLAKD